MTITFRRAIHANDALAGAEEQRSAPAGDVNAGRANGGAAGQSTIWGLTVRELHDAYWRTHGVQCLRPGPDAEETTPLDRKADLYMLLAPQQLVLFDLSHIVNRLVWHGAALTYVRVIDLFGASYREETVVDERGFVERIARHYVSARTRHRVLLTDRPRVALRWADARSIRDAKRAVRRSLAVSSIDHVHTTGCCFDESTSSDRALCELIERWADPNRALEGVREVAPRVWTLSTPLCTERPMLLIGPAWLGTHWNAARNGRTGAPHPSGCIVGPAWRFDRRVDNGQPMPAARILDFGEIEQRHTIRGAAAPAKRHAYVVAKRAFDIAASLAALTLLAPLQLLIALAIVLDDGGPVLFRHRRQSRGGKAFDCLKFRTMRRDAETMVSQLKDSNLCDGPQVFIKDDPRVTRIGRLLRRFHLDELPQLWNVLVGDMSIVGPRPSPDNENQFCPAWRELRLSVRPGITGLWQLKRTRLPGRDFQEWIRYDIEYVRSASFRLDLSIIIRTAFALLLGRSRPCD